MEEILKLIMGNPLKVLCAKDERKNPAPFLLATKSGMPPQKVRGVVQL